MNEQEEKLHPWKVWERERKKHPRERSSARGGVLQLNSIIENWRGSRRIRDNLLEADIFLRWAEIAGQKVADHSTPLKLDRGKLIIQVEDSSWRHQLHFMRRDLIGKINRELNGKIVSEIVFTA